MSDQIKLPNFSDSCTTADLIAWINSRSEPTKDLLDATCRKIAELEFNLEKSRIEAERLKESENTLRTCERMCMELRDRLKYVAGSQPQDIAKEFDSIAVFDQADSRAQNIADIIMARRTWNETAESIRNADEEDSITEDAIFNLLESNATLSKISIVPDRVEFLEKTKDSFLSWYSAKLAIALSSESEDVQLFSIKEKYAKLERIDDFYSIIRHYIADQCSPRFGDIKSLADLFIDLKDMALNNYDRFMKSWAKKLLDSPPQFISSSITESINKEWKVISDGCSKAVENSLEEDQLGGNFMEMMASFKKVSNDVLSRLNENHAMAMCVSNIANNILFTIASDYKKIVTSYLSFNSNTFTRSGSFSTCIDNFSTFLSRLIKDSDYVMEMSIRVYGNYSVIFILSSFRAMYDNLVPSFMKLCEICEEKVALKNSEIFRSIVLVGQLVLWINDDRNRLETLLSAYMDERENSMEDTPAFFKDDVKSFDEKISRKSEGDLSIVEARSLLLSIAKRFVTCGVDLLTRPLLIDITNGLKNLKTQYLCEKAESSMVESDLPSFSTSPNEFITATGVSLLSITHQLSTYSHDASMAAALAVGLIESTVDDVVATWMEKCSALIQKCFIDSVGSLENLPMAFGRQLGINYNYLADVFEDLGTTQTAEFVKMRALLTNQGYVEEN